ncbi:MAG: hypothetical protein HY242_11155 [Afipia sp.]|nr:hypothetical protein [Afipia sp.]
MMSRQRTETKDYSGLFLGVILGGLVVIVLVLMVSVEESRVRIVGAEPP